MVHQGREKRDVMTDAVDGEGVERVGLRGDRLPARRRMGDELGDHRIVIERDFAAFGDAGVVAHRDAVDARLRGRPVAPEAADGGQEIAIRILGINAGLDRPAVELHVALADRELLAGGDAQHLLDQIDAGDQLRHRMLDLQPRVHLEEVEALVLAGDEFHGAGRIVADGLGVASATACSPIAWRVATSRSALGASSATFWLRRWIEHSRSPR